MAYYDNEENAVVNTEPEVSETPATLVGKNLENKTTEDEIWSNEHDQKIVQQGISSLYGDIWDVKTLGYIWGKLSSNPTGFGFTIQKIVEPFNTTATYNVDDAVVYQGKVYICSYTHTGAWNVSHFAGLGNPQTLYLSQVYDKGQLVGYVPFYYDQNKREIVRLYNSSIPNYRAVNKGQETPVNVVTEPKTTDPLFAKINLGIKTGDIEIPQPEIPVVEPGTKLYKHSLTDNTNYIGYEIITAGTKSLQTNQIVSFKAQVFTTGECYVWLKYSSGSPTTINHVCLEITNAGVVNGLKTLDLYGLTDTVTEL